MKAQSTIMPAGRYGIAREGYPFILLGLVLTLVLGWLFWPLGLLALVFAAFSIYFFRDPTRVFAGGVDLLLSPADGTVLKNESLAGTPQYPEAHRKISIFMSPMNVHVNSIPCDGSIEQVLYHPGKFFVASLDKASEQNERNTVVLKTLAGDRVAFTQIAGLVARRIVCYLKQGHAVKRGERYGLIRFGSRMEVSFPLHWEVLVQPGQRIQAGATPLAKMRSA